MTVTRSTIGAGLSAITLETPEVAVTVLPEKGCDIYSFVHRRTGTDFLFKTPWTPRPLGHSGWTTDSKSHWLEHYPGGWQLLLPNGGAACLQQGTEWGFHGEANMVPWEVVAEEASAVDLATSLFRAPLRVSRRLSVDAAVLRIEESVTNLSGESIDVMWSHHPAFGAPFLEAGCVVSCPATSLTADDEWAGTDLAPGSVHEWPTATTTTGATVDYTIVPGPDSGRGTLAYLGGLSDGYFAITNPRLGIGFGLRWPLDVFPSAWLWEEMECSPGWPWFERTYVMAIEPATTVPGQGLVAAVAKGGTALTLAGEETRTAVLEAVAFDEGGPVAGIDPGGTVRFGD